MFAYCAAIFEVSSKDDALEYIEKIRNQKKTRIIKIGN